MNKKTTLEMFNDIKDFEMPDGPEITVKDVVPFYCQKIEQDLTRLEKLESYLIKWNELLSIDGINSKSMVKNDIQYLLKEKEEQQKHEQ